MYKKIIIQTTIGGGTLNTKSNSKTRIGRGIKIKHVSIGTRQQQQQQQQSDSLMTTSTDNIMEPHHYNAKIGDLPTGDTPIEKNTRKLISFSFPSLPLQASKKGRG